MYIYYLNDTNAFLTVLLPEINKKKDWMQEFKFAGLFYFIFYVNLSHKKPQNILACFMYYGSTLKNSCLV